MLSTALLVGCDGAFSDEAACTTLGYSHQLVVEVSGDVDRVAGLRLCDASGCAPELDSQGSPPEGVGTQVTRSGDRWQFVLFGTPDEVTVEVTDDDGTVTSVEVADVPWDRVSGSEECPGSHEAVVDVAV